MSKMPSNVPIHQLAISAFTNVCTIFFFLVGHGMDSFVQLWCPIETVTTVTHSYAGNITSVVVIWAPPNR